MSEIETVYSREAEEALIGSLIIDPLNLESIETEPADLHDKNAQAVLSAMRAIQARGELGTANVITIAEELKGIPDGDKVGGIFGLAEYSARCPNACDAEGYARVIQRTVERRSALHAANKLANAAYKQDADIQAAIAGAVDSLVKAGNSKAGAISIRRIASELFDEVDAAQQSPNDYFGIPTGMPGFDRITSGLQRGEVTMLAGEPGVGKSSFAMQLCEGMARGAYGKNGTPGVVYQLEMSSLATWRRIVALKAGIRSKAMRSGRLTEVELERFARVQAELAGLPIFISDRTDWTTFGLRSDIARLKLEHDIGWVLIDYMGLLGDDPHLTETERSAIVSDRVHHIAKDFDVSVLAVQDMTKAGVTGAVQGQAGLAGSRRVMYNADSILFLKQENRDRAKKDDEPEYLRLEWAKYREDSSERFVRLQRVAGQAAFTEI